MSKIKVVLLAIVFSGLACAGIETVAKTALLATEYVVVDAGEFLANPDHRALITEMAIEVVTGTKISAIDIIGHCAVQGCHSIKL